VTRTVFRALAAISVAGLALSAPAAAQQPEQPEPGPQMSDRVLKETHGAWEIHCVEGTDACVMQQFGNTQDGKRAMLVMVERLAGVEAQGQPVPAAMTVLTPMGVWIPYGVRLKVDQGEVMPMPLMRCLGENCFARAPLRQQDVEMFKRGSQAKFEFVLTDGVLVDLSLNGFTAAYNALKPQQVQAQN
jgi:invasion protein IalB